MFPDPFCACGIKEPDAVKEGADSAGCGFYFVRSGGDQVGYEGLETGVLSAIKFEIEKGGILGHFRNFCRRCFWGNLLNAHLEIYITSEA